MAAEEAAREGALECGRLELRGNRSLTDVLMSLSEKLYKFTELNHTVTV